MFNLMLFCSSGTDGHQTDVLVAVFLRRNSSTYLVDDPPDAMICDVLQVVLVRCRSMIDCVRALLPSCCQEEESTDDDAHDDDNSGG